MYDRQVKSQVTATTASTRNLTINAKQ